MTHCPAPTPDANGNRHAAACKGHDRPELACCGRCGREYDRGAPCAWCLGQLPVRRST